MSLCHNTARLRVSIPGEDCAASERVGVDGYITDCAVFQSPVRIRLPQNFEYDAELDGIYIGFQSPVRIRLPQNRHQHRYCGW